MRHTFIFSYALPGARCPWTPALDTQPFRPVSLHRLSLLSTNSLWQNSSHKHGPQHLGVKKNASFRRSPVLPPISRAPASRLLLMPQVARRRSSQTSAQGFGDGSERQLARFPPSQDVQKHPTPLRATSVNSSQAFTV